MADFNSMKWKIKDLPITDLFKTFPDLLQLYNEVLEIMGDAEQPHEGLSKEQITALVVYTYHLQSPLVQQEASIHKRRFKALQLLGINIADVESDPNAKYIIGNNTFLNRLAIQLCKLEENFDWLELCRKTEILDDLYLTLKMEMGGTDKKSANDIMKIKLDIDAKAEHLKTTIRQLSHNIFRADDNLLNFVASQEIIEKRRPLITPERAAARQRELINK